MDGFSKGKIRMMSLKARVIVAVLLAIVIIGCAGAQDTLAAADAPRSQSAVIMISLDGLAGFYLDDPKADMPTLRAMAKQGARAESMKASTPSVTWPNHTTLVTGDNPARHGVLGNNYLDRNTLKSVTLIGDPIYNKEQIVKVPTIYDLAHEAGMKTAALRWPATRGAKTLDWVIPTCHDEKVAAKYTTPSLLTECKAAGIWDGKFPLDQTCTDVLDFILRKHHPRLALLHLGNTDHVQHLNGPRTKEAYAAIKTIDAQVRQVWDEVKRDYPEGATIFIVSDHGFSPISHAIFPNVILRDAGLVEVKDGKIVGGDVRIVPQGGSAFLYILDESRRDELAERIQSAFAGAKGLEKIIPTDQLHEYGVATPEQDPHAPDMVLFADEGYVFGDTAAGALPFVEKPERSGTHGHDPNLPDLHATFVVWGAGIKPGTKIGIIDNIDVAPTIAKLLGLDLPQPDGKVLTEILARD
jgi:predicted AlkP superfamily pyrophosphatase or phosphodiesterase